MLVVEEHTEPTVELLEDPIILRDSKIWTLQRNFYEQKGIDCWKEGVVPFFVTSNSFIAYEYANCILGYIRDYYSKPGANTQQPIYIVEVGSGHGKLAYLILMHLLELKESFPQGVERPFVYVVSDFTAKIIDSVKENILLKPFVEQGILDFAIFDCEEQSEIELINSHQVLNATEITTPLIFIANYVFNGLKQDLYNVTNGEFQEGYIGVSTDRKEENPEDPSIIQRMHFNWIFKKSTHDDLNLYKDEQFNKIIQTYKERHNNFTLLFPYGPLLAMKNMSSMSRGKFLLLTADKAYSHEDDIKMFQGPPHVAIHGCFSLMVNFHALRIYTLLNNGYSLHTPYYNGLKVASYVFGSKKRRK